MAEKKMSGDELTDFYYSMGAAKAIGDKATLAAAKKAVPKAYAEWERLESGKKPSTGKRTKTTGAKEKKPGTVKRAGSKTAKKK